MEAHLYPIDSIWENRTSSNASDLSKIISNGLSPHLSASEREVLNCRCVIFTEIIPRAAREIRRYPDFAICPDTASTHVRIAAILLMGVSGAKPIIELLAKDHTPTYWVKMRHRANLIYGLEVLALMAFIFTHRKVLRNSAVNAYIDNNNGLRALIRGDSDTAVIADMTAIFWRALQ